MFRLSSKLSKNISVINALFPDNELYGDLDSNIVSINDLDNAIDNLSKKLLSGDLGRDGSENVQGMIDTYVSLREEIEAITQELTGTTGGDLADSLADIFTSGEDAAKQWGDTVDEIIQNVIISQLKSQLLVKPIQDAIDKLTRDAADDGLDTDEALDFKKTVTNLQAGYADAFAALDETFKEAGINLGDSAESATSGLSGAIGRQITEDTATELQGIWNRSLFETISHTAILNESNGYLSEIAVNTLDTANELRTLNEKIGSDSSQRDTGNLI
jgi:hypothetical protein